MVFPLAVLVAILGVSSATFVQDCGSTATINSVMITNCDIPPCLLHRGESIEVEIDFVNTKASQTLTTTVKGNIAGINIPWMGVDSNACNGLAPGDCPLEPNEKAVYTAEAPVLEEYPSLDVVVTWELQDDNGDKTACFLIPAKVV